MTGCLKIAVNTRLLRKDKLDGIGWFTFNTLRHIVKAHPETEFHFFFDAPPDDSFLFGANVVPYVLFPPARHALLNIVWFEWSVRHQLRNLQPDLFLSPDGMLCLGWNGKQLAVIHDINFLHHPSALKFSNRHYYNFFFPRFARKATRIATVSKFSQQDIAANYHIPPSMIDVVYNGVNDFYQPIDDAEKEKVRQQYAGGHPYFVFIGTLSPRKNVLGLMKAFEHYKKQYGCDSLLLIVGGSMYKTAELYDYQKQLQFGSCIHFLGRLPDAELNRILGAALALVFVPFFEGFGIPVIEAMQCRVPVITSNITSLPEVAGDAAILVDPTDTAAISGAMHQLVTDISLRNRLIEKGILQKEQFTWERAAQRLWDSVCKCL